MRPTIASTISSVLGPPSDAGSVTSADGAGVGAAVGAGVASGTAVTVRITSFWALPFVITGVPVSVFHSCVPSQIEPRTT